MNVLFISYDGMTDPLGQSQVIPYLQGLSKAGYDIFLLSCEKKQVFDQNKAAIEKLQSFDGEITVSTTLDATGPVDFTFGGAYAGKELFNKGYKLRIYSHSVQQTDGTHLQYDSYLQTTGVNGIVNGNSYEINVIAYTTSILSLQPNGQVDVKHV